MRIRMVCCPEDAHSFPWMIAEECSHWSMQCPRAKKAKKPKHKLTRGEPGYLVTITGIPPEGWPYDYDSPPWALELSEPKRVNGRWVTTPGDIEAGYHGIGSGWIPAARGNLITCTTECGFMGAE